MKRFVCFVLVAVLAVGAAVLCGCKSNAFDKAVKGGDDYTIVCAYDDNAKVLTAVQTVKLTNRSENSFDAVKFHLYPNAYREDAAHPVVPQSYKSIAYPNGNSWGEIALDSVKVDGVPVAFVIEGGDADILSVPTGREWFPDEKLTVDLAYTVSLANVRHRLGWTEKTVNLGNFFPVVCVVENGQYSCTGYLDIGDPFVSEIANFDVSLKIDQQFLVGATGSLVEATAEGQFVTYRYVAQAVRDFAFVCSKNFKKLCQTVDGVTVNYLYFNDEEGEKSVETACGMLKFLQKNVGKYPYKQLTVCETDFCYGGMEYPQMVMVTTKQQHYRDAVAHEVAHQWFYGVVGNNQIENAWMDEGLAEFATYLYLDSTGEVSLSQNVLNNTRTYTTYVDVLNNYYNSADTSFRALDKYKNDNEYVVINYVKGSLLFATVHETMGATKFYRALGRYFDKCAYTVAAPAQLVQCFVDVGGEEIGKIFEAFACGKEIIGKVTD